MIYSHHLLYVSSKPAAEVPTSYLTNTLNFSVGNFGLLSTGCLESSKLAVSKRVHAKYDTTTPFPNSMHEIHRKYLDLAVIASNTS